MDETAGSGEADRARIGREYFSYVRGLCAAASISTITELIVNFDWFLSVPWWMKVVRISITLLAVGYWWALPRYDPQLRHAFTVGISFFILRSVTLAQVAEPHNAAFFYSIALVAVTTLAQTRRDILITLVVGALAFLIARDGLIPPKAYLGFGIATLFAGYFGMSFLSFRGRLFELLSRLKGQTRTDQMTGLKNRRALHDDLEEDFRRLQRNGTLFSLLLIDVDHFKKVNDRYGHAAGDALLKALAADLRAGIRNLDRFGAGEDRVYRFGGEEFAVIVPNADMDAAAKVADRLRRRIESTRFDADPDAGPLPGAGMTISAGIATATRGMHWSELYNAADLALYRAKNLGRNRVERADRAAPGVVAPDAVASAMPARADANSG
ncbi:GGDEF domain-containing protein [Nisaea sediminum]|uniref:GGDEF domain-containing protein n=1 Tax=Nisaea sediminum TaxID=2775867 RepID=UPI001866676B|nr:GGDEF domain-containing protein [Nisaea sediminum]